MEADANGSVFSTIMNRIRSRREPAADTAATDIPTVASPVVPEGSRMPSTTRQAAQTLGMPSMAEAAVPTAGAAGATLGGSLATEDDVMRPARDAQQQWGGRGGYYYSYTPAKGNTPAKIQLHGGPQSNRAGLTITESSNPDAFRAIMSEYDDMSRQGTAQPYVSLQEYRRQAPQNDQNTQAEQAVASLISDGTPGTDFEQPETAFPVVGAGLGFRGTRQGTGAGSTLGVGRGASDEESPAAPAGTSARARTGRVPDARQRQMVEDMQAGLGNFAKRVRPAAAKGEPERTPDTGRAPADFVMPSPEAARVIAAYERADPLIETMYRLLSPEEKEQVARYLENPAR